MGKTWSKSSHQSGETNVEINEHIEQNTLAHDAHEVKLWIIIILLIIQLTFTIHKNLKRKWKRQGFDQAKQLSTINIHDQRHPA